MEHEPRLLFVNLPVADVERSRAFFQHLGFAFDERFCDGTAACMVVSDQAYVMLLQHARFRDFATRPIADVAGTTAGLYCVSASSRADVDVFADAAFAAGARPAQDPTDHGFMYARSFLDLDGHHWEVMWMTPEPVEESACTPTTSTLIA